MELRAWNLTLLAALGTLWLASGIQREKAILSAHAPALAALEMDVATYPADAVRRRALAQSYLDAHAPGLALSIIESAPDAVHADPSLEHVHARALLELGRSADALRVEQRVLAACDGVPPCEGWLVASASRRVAFLQELVALGVEDAQAHPEASALAYHNVTREARLAVQ